MFQFLKGSIQANKLLTDKLSVDQSFNSLKVRFRRESFFEFDVVALGFNSLKVRFRQAYKITIQGGQMFQFLKGSIQACTLRP